MGLYRYILLAALAGTMAVHGLSAQSIGEQMGALEKLGRSLQEELNALRGEYRNQQKLIAFSQALDLSAETFERYVKKGDVAELSSHIEEFRTFSETLPIEDELRKKVDAYIVLFSAYGIINNHVASERGADGIRTALNNAKDDIYPEHRNLTNALYGQIEDYVYSVYRLEGLLRMVDEGKEITADNSRLKDVSSIPVLKKYYEEYRNGDSVQRSRIRAALNEIYPESFSN